MSDFIVVIEFAEDSRVLAFILRAIDARAAVRGATGELTRGEYASVTSVRVAAMSEMQLVTRNGNRLAA